MIMSVDKSWLTNPNRRSPEYQLGLDSFIEMCKEHVDSRGYVRCACARCHNSVLIPFIKMKYHMHAYGILRTYKKWTYHGESLIPAVVSPRNSGGKTKKQKLTQVVPKNGGHLSFPEPNSEGEFKESSASHPNDVAVTEKVLGAQRGHISSVERKPSSSTESSFVGDHEKEPGHHEQEEESPLVFTQDQIVSLFQDPSFREQLLKFMASNNASNKASNKASKSNKGDKGDTN